MFAEGTTFKLATYNTTTRVWEPVTDVSFASKDFANPAVGAAALREYFNYRDGTNQLADVTLFIPADPSTVPTNLFNVALLVHTPDGQTRPLTLEEYEMIKIENAKYELGFITPQSRFVLAHDLLEDMPNNPVSAGQMSVAIRSINYSGLSNNAEDLPSGGVMPMVLLVHDPIEKKKTSITPAQLAALRNYNKVA
ncbi:MAG: hypothetical protein EYC62_01930 [Alphaproteobacteria bacterium]|nr:MAG: hypothetical protein EYC62_01930 [Alphaproteobacteria bacterium]